MNSFESFLAQKLEEYVTYRKNLGYAKKALRHGLNDFDRYLKEQNAGWDDMQPAFFLQLRANIHAKAFIPIILCKIFHLFRKSILSLLSFPRKKQNDF